MLDSGNICDHPTPAGDLKTAALVDAMGQLGYRAANVGERDLMLGYEKFRERTAGAGFPFVSTNVVRKDSGEPVFSPYEILPVKIEGGKTLQVGVFGVARFNPMFLKSGPDGTNIIIRKPVDAIAEYYDEVVERSDVVVLLAAMHKEDARAVVRAYPGIDYVIGAYGGMYTTREEKEGETLLLYTGNQGKRIGESRVFLGDDGDVSGTVSYMHLLAKNYPSEEAMTAWVAGIAREVAALSKPAGISGGSAP